MNCQGLLVGSITGGVMDTGKVYRYEDSQTLYILAAIEIASCIYYFLVDLDTGKAGPFEAYKSNATEGMIECTRTIA